MGKSQYWGKGATEKFAHYFQNFLGIQPKSLLSQPPQLHTPSVLPVGWTTSGGLHGRDMPSPFSLWEAGYKVSRKKAQICSNYCQIPQLSPVPGAMQAWP
jgi:hypothetical protein